MSLSCLAFLLTACGGDDQNAIKKNNVLTIYHINDHHSHLDEEQMSFNLDLGQGAESFEVSRGGFARVANFINSHADNMTNAIKIHAGDAITGDLYFNLSNGKADADMMNTVCFDSMTLGNHEFDAKDQGLKDFVGYLDQGNCKEKTKILSANVTFGASSPLYKSNRIEKSTVFERDGEKYGLVGLTIASKTKNASQPNADTEFADELKTAQQEIDQLKQQGVNRIILQTHVGYSLDKNLAQQLTDVDVIIGGDSHTLLGPESLIKYGLTPEGEYPTQLKNKNGGLVCVAQAWQYSYVVGELNVEFNPDGSVERCSGTPHVLISDDYRRKSNGILVSPAEKQQINQKILQDKAPLTVSRLNETSSNILKTYSEVKNSFASKIVGQAVDNLCLRRVPGLKLDSSRSTLGDVCNKNAHVNAHGGDIQQIVAEAFLQQGKNYFGAQISFQNGGGVRIDLPQGNITVANIYTVLPFKNTLVQLNMTGNEIKQTLEDAISGVIEQKNTGSYPYTGGLKWDVDLTQPKGQRISNIAVRMQDGSYESLQNNQTYKVVTINFLADGADYYTTMKTIGADRRVDVGLDYAEAFLKYVDAIEGAEGTKQISKLATSLYSTQKFIE